MPLAECSRDLVDSAFSRERTTARWQQKDRKKVLLEAGLAAQLCCPYPEKEVSVLSLRPIRTQTRESRIDTFLIALNSREAFPI